MTVAQAITAGRSELDGARALVNCAIAQYQPVRSFVLFSGGQDSTVLAHWATTTLRDGIDALVFIDTGTALPGVREFAGDLADLVNARLLVYEAGDAYTQLVLELGGFPGPAGHERAYQRLKERCIRQLVREHKTKRSDRVMLLTGKRTAESSRRSRTTAGIERNGAQLYVNPLMAWGDDFVRDYRVRHRLPQSDVAALLHRSGECNCGAFAAKGEREMLRSLFPAWWQRTIAPLETEARRRGITACVWGRRPPGPPPLQQTAPACAGCRLRMERETHTVDATQRAA
ncbi:MAG: hypothetical protein V7607_5459 [Solirubrobacteraceae bacterium]